jgi:hypothetical protein
MNFPIDWPAQIFWALVCGATVLVTAWISWHVGRATGKIEARNDLEFSGSCSCGAPLDENGNCVHCNEPPSADSFGFEDHK